MNQINWTIDLLIGFFDFYFNFKPHSYQQRFLEKCLTHNRIAGKWPRQSGKSTTVSAYTLFRALTDKVNIIIVAPTQTQSGELYEKIRELAVLNPLINKQIVKDTVTELKFENGSRIISLPSGHDGKTIRGYTADIAIVEEAGQMSDQVVNTVIIPMIASKGINGQVIKIGTPWLRNHFYRSCYEDKGYEVISIDWKEVVEQGQYDMNFINEQKMQLTDTEFLTEYQSEFIDEISSYFPLSLLEKCKLNYKLYPII